MLSRHPVVGGPWVPNSHGRKMRITFAKDWSRLRPRSNGQGSSPELFCAHRGSDMILRVGAVGFLGKIVDDGALRNAY
jgi:hypothetical protein